jgi:hypothetical protein
MDVYAQFQQRAKRDQGAKFDTLVRDARQSSKACTQAGQPMPGDGR